jgi:hypothetical protein
MCGGLLFANKDSVKMTLDASGRLGIGHTSPANWLDISANTSSTVGHISLNTTSVSNAIRMFYRESGTAVAQIGWSVDGNALELITSKASSQMIFYTVNTERMRIDSSGNVGIGTSSPSFASGGGLAIYNSSVPRLKFANSTTGDASTDGTQLLVSGSDFYIQQREAASVIIATNGSDRVTVDSSGNLLVGTTSALATTTHSFVASGASSGAPMASRNQGATAGKYWTFGPDSSNNYRVFNNGGTGMYMVDGATAWTATSDERKKDIIEPIVDATNKVSSLRAVIGKYKTDENGVRRSFLIAQDVQAVFPEAVNASNPDELGVQYTDVIPLLVAAIKEQQILITTLTARITALETN